MENLKQSFIKYFGQKKWDEEKLLEKLFEIEKTICEDYICFEPIPIIFIDEEVSKYGYQDKVIYLSIYLKDDFNSLLRSMIHELEHYFQHNYIVRFPYYPKAKRWKKELESYNPNDLNNYYNNELELDAFAFTQVVLYTEFGIIWEHKDKIVQQKINAYKHKLASDL